MKKFASLIIAAALLASPALHAANGNGAQNGTNGGNQFGWGIGLGGLTTIALIAGLVASSSSKKPASFNH